jgi:glycosyltransferase involved in cell wall biosynthesis
MRILFDARWIFPEISGIGRYTQELLRHLLLVDRENEYVLLFDRQDVLERTARDTGFADAPNARAELLPWGPFSPASQLRLPRRLRAERAQVYHAPNYMIPYAAFPRRRGGALRCVVTLHDLIPLLFPQYTPRALKTRFLPVFRRVMRETGARADWILTPSAHTRRDVIDCLGLPAARADRVVAIPEGVGEQYRPAPERVRRRTPPVVPRSCMSAASIRTRTSARSSKPCRSSCGACRRPACASSARPMPAILKLPPAPARWAWTTPSSGAATRGPRSCSTPTAAPPCSRCPRATRASACRCSKPWPAARPWSAETAARCLKSPATRLRVPPDDPAALAAALARVLDDPAEAARLRRLGLERATLFSWDRAARETWAIYEEAAFSSSDEPA